MATKQANGTGTKELVATDAVIQSMKELEAIVSPKDKAIVLERIQRQTIIIPIIGLTPLIPGKWSEKAKAMMRESQSGPKTKAKKEPKIAEVDAEGRTYRLPDGRPGVPAVNFKCAIVDACRFFDGLPMTTAKRAFYVIGEGPEQLVPIIGEGTIREDMVRNATGVADIRYRMAFWPWAAELRVSFITRLLDQASVINLVDAAGQCGVCEWRPSSPKSSSGTYGMFQLDESRPVRVEG